MEGFFTILGLCITFVPLIVFCKYLLGHVITKSSFDLHVEKVLEYKGKIGVVLAYVDKILLSLMVCFLGIWMSEYFTNEILGMLFVICLLGYIIVHYFDKRNEQ